MSQRQLDSFILYNMVHFDEDDCRQPAIERAVYETYPDLAEADVVASLSRLNNLRILSAQPAVFRGEDEVNWSIANFPLALATLKRWQSEAPRRRLSALAG